MGGIIILLMREGALLSQMPAPSTVSYRATDMFSFSSMSSPGMLTLTNGLSNNPNLTPHHVTAATVLISMTAHVK